MSGMKRGRHRRRIEGGTPHRSLVPALEHRLEVVNTRCGDFSQALKNRDVNALERTAYALAGAWLLAEARTMEILSRSAVTTDGKYARRALAATSAVVTARFGEALAQTWAWLTARESLPGLRRLRVVLVQLATRVDNRDVALVRRLVHYASQPRTRG
jgi:hypothetical protein